jgi:hypothetical protein
MSERKIEVVDGSDRADDEFFYGPDVGQAVRRGGFLYTKYGEVLPGNAPLRMLNCSSDGVDENYADWSEEYRRAVREAYAAQARKREAEEAARRAHRDAIVEQARAKLSTEEFDAVYGKGADDERGY